MQAEEGRERKRLGEIEEEIGGEGGDKGYERHLTYTVEEGPGRGVTDRPLVPSRLHELSPSPP